LACRFDIFLYFRALIYRNSGSDSRDKSRIFSADSENMIYQMRSRYSGVIAVAMMIVTVALAAGCGDDKPYRETTAAVSSTKLQPDQVTSKAHIFLYKAGRKTTDLTADEIQQFTRLDSTIAVNIAADFFDSTGAWVSNLTAKKGYIREKNNYLAVSGSVVVVGQDSARLETEYLVWDADHDKVVTDSFVTITRNQDVLRGYGLETDPALKNTTLKRQVSGRLTQVEKLKK
jgi:LPS export ABC transporter protein LptC